MTKVKVELESCDFIKLRSHRDIPHVIVVQMSYYYHVDTIICQMCGPKSNNYHPEGNTYTQYTFEFLNSVATNTENANYHVFIINTKVLLYQAQGDISGYHVEALWFSCSQRFFTYISTLNVPDEGYSRNASCALNLMSTFLFICN